MSDFDDTLAAAEQLWKHGDHDGAWLALEELPPIDRVMPQVIDLRLRILTCLCKWESGDGLADQGEEGSTPNLLARDDGRVVMSVNEWATSRHTQ